jgi:hypothetical protein
MSVQARALVALVVVLVLVLAFALAVGLLGPVHSTVTHT